MSNGNQLRDLAEVVDCEHKTALRADQGSEYAYSVGTPALRGRDVDFEEAKPVDEPTYRAWTRRAEPSTGDIILAREAPVGGVGFVDGSRRVCLGQRTVLVRPNPERLVPRFLFFALQSPQVQSWMSDRSSGSTVAHINVADVRELPLPFLPSLAVQRRIVGVLGALDDLIDTNKRLIASLANMRAAAWSSVTPIANATLGSVAVLCADRATPSELSGDTVYLGLEHFAEAGAGLVSRGRAHGLDSQKSRFQRGDVLYGKLRPYFRKVARPDFDGICSTEIWVLRPSTDVTAEYLESVVSSQPFTDHAMRGSGGTHMPRARWDHVSGFPIAIPNAAEMEKVTRITEPMWRLMWSLDAENETLSGVRDELLPLLLSGAISVAEITP